MKAVPTEATNATAPVTQVSARRPRQAAMKNLPHRWITMKNMNSSTLHRCRLLTKCPVAEKCHHDGPLSARRPPEISTTSSADKVSTPNTYIHDATYAGWLSGSILSGGNAVSQRFRSRPVQPAAADPAADSAAD